MRLVLLPGLNGSSALFAPLLAELGDIDCHTLELPDHGLQDYACLADALFEQLGTTPFVLLGKSFSGPLAYQLALRQPIELRGVIFAASFLGRPNPALPLLAHLPTPKALATQPWLLRALCLGKAAGEHTLSRVQQEIRRLDQRLLRARLATLASLQVPRQTLDLPCLHIWPQQDRLITDSAAQQLAQACSDIRQFRLDGPHFILQTQAQTCAWAITEFMQEIAAGYALAGSLRPAAPTSPAFP